MSRVLGRGAMGTALAHALSAEGHDVVVWNRSARDLGQIGLTAVAVATDLADAVRGAATVIICVCDHHASRELVERLAPALPSGAPVVNLSSGTSEEAVESADAASTLDVAYVTGTIMVPTPLVGTEHNLVLCAGPAHAVATVQPVFTLHAGESLGLDSSSRTCSATTAPPLREASGWCTTCTADPVCASLLQDRGFDDDIHHEERNGLLAATAPARGPKQERRSA